MVGYALALFHEVDDFLELLVHVRATPELPQALQTLVNAVLPDEPVGRLGGDEQEEQSLDHDHGHVKNRRGLVQISQGPDDEAHQDTEVDTRAKHHRHPRTPVHPGYLGKVHLGLMEHHAAAKAQDYPRDQEHLVQKYNR